jgi:hypothetical protein
VGIGFQNHGRAGQENQGENQMGSLGGLKLSFSFDVLHFIVIFEL